MPRTARVAPGRLVSRVLNRSAGKRQLFAKDADFEAFKHVMIEAHQHHPIRLLAYAVLSNHWYFLVWPEEDGQVTEFFRWLTQTHAMRWRGALRTVGYGPLYQGRFQSFPVPCDDHLLTVLRYVERNPLAAGLVERAEQWRWSSLWVREHRADVLKALLSAWPVECPTDWTDRVNAALSVQELKRMRVSLERSRPYGADDWVKQKATELDLEHTLRPEGRPPEVDKPEAKTAN